MYPHVTEIFSIPYPCSTADFHISAACPCIYLKYLEIIRAASMIDFLLSLT